MTRLMGCVMSIVHGDCLEVLKSYPDNHFTSVITDPPYGFIVHGQEMGSCGQAV